MQGRVANYLSSFGIGFLFVIALLVQQMSSKASAEEINLRVAGNLIATGLIQKNKEQPFFENFAAKTGLPVNVQYQPMDVVGIKDVEGLRVLKSWLGSFEQFRAVS